MIEEIYSVTQIYTIGDTDMEPVVVDPRFKNLTVVVQPLNLVNPPTKLTASLLTDANSVAANLVTGTVTIKARPPKTINKYTLLTDMDLASPDIISSGIPMHKVFPEVTTAITGCTHLAVSVIGYAN
ncbi:hypothetical protein COPG_00047 [Colwellia phage 9A]|uniref:Uncharacterized protein n=1 Tax=Colwellia phage 9A TaxID=765765 RepID=I3UMC8_9CAUD|nr:hypothetical protein COPG_00047 [Colwellia phage 9A]AFK66643.1 hypothetical protein COPG_00047 [Colwellia phage 9A]